MTLTTTPTQHPHPHPQLEPGPRPGRHRGPNAGGATPSVSASTPSVSASVGAPVTVGVDTHQLTLHAAVVDGAGRRVGDQQFPTTAAGYRELHTWAVAQGTVSAFGVESTGSYGAGLTRYLHTTGVEVFEVNRPEKATRVKHGKSDPVDAYSAAEQVRTGRAVGRAKDTTGAVEALRAVKMPRDSAVRDRTRAYGQLRDLITTAPGPLHDELIVVTSKKRVTKTLLLRPDPARLDEPLHATRHALRTLARRIQALNTEIAQADTIITRLVKQICPRLLEMYQVGPQSAAQLIITAGQNIDRMTSEAAFAKLTGVAPLPASSGKTTRHRLNRGGDRQANSALYMIIIGRMKKHPETRAYVEKRRAQGLSNPEIIRCLKRHLARRIYRTLKHDLLTP